MILHLIERYRGAVAVVLAAGWIVFLIAIDLVGAALEDLDLRGTYSSGIPEVPSPISPRSSIDRCLTMPDGPVVCDAP